MIDQLSARIALSSLSFPGDTQVGANVRMHGPVDALDRLRRLCGDKRTDEAITGAHAEIERSRDEGAHLVTPESALWPSQLNDLGDEMPLVLYVRGQVDQLRIRASAGVAIVGARMCSSYGRAVADDIAHRLARNGWCVISGLAFGIDAAAHLGALAAGGFTVGITAGGVNVATPRAHEELFERVADQGAIVGELALGSPPTKGGFLMRNRVIAAMSRSVVVVEAAKRSGARNTAAHAIRMNRVVAAVPGPATSASSVTCHELIRSGEAVLVTNATEVEELIRPIGGMPWMELPSRA